MPIKKLYVMPRVDRTSLESIDKVVKLWAGFTGTAVATATTPQPAATPRPGPSVRPFPSPTTGTRPTGPSDSADGMLTMARLTDDLTQSIVAKKR
jgi:hypothetical protein